MRSIAVRRRHDPLEDLLLVRVNPEPPRAVPEADVTRLKASAGRDALPLRQGRAPVWRSRPGCGSPRKGRSARRQAGSAPTAHPRGRAPRRSSGSQWRAGSRARPHPAVRRAPRSPRCVSGSPFRVVGHGRSVARTGRPPSREAPAPSGSSTMPPCRVIDKMAEARLSDALLRQSLRKLGTAREPQRRDRPGPLRDCGARCVRTHRHPSTRAEG
jgi:hypothetical protein